MVMLRKFYHNFCRRIYSVGKTEYYRYMEKQARQRVTAGPQTRFYGGSTITNLSGDPSRIRIGTNCHISGLIMVYAYGGEIIMGDHCSLSPHSRIISTSRISIGNRVLIAHNVNIIDNNSHPIDARLRHQDFIETYQIGMQPHDLNAAEIIIEDDVWIGFNVAIKKGVRIGRGAIIGSDSVVTKDVPAWTVNIGNPLRCIRTLDPVEVKN